MEKPFARFDIKQAVPIVPDLIDESKDGGPATFLSITKPNGIPEMHKGQTIWDMYALNAMIKLVEKASPSHLTVDEKEDICMSAAAFASGMLARRPK
jgi:hypothetical protein